MDQKVVSEGSTSVSEQADTLDINLRIDGETLSLRIDRKDERCLRAGANEVNRLLELYRHRYGTQETSRRELFMYTALHLAARAERMRFADEDLNMEKHLQALSDKLDEALYSASLPPTTLD